MHLFKQYAQIICTDNEVDDYVLAPGWDRAVSFYPLGLPFTRVL